MRPPINIVLREHQQRAYDEISEAFLYGHRRVVLEALTGFGKTGLACALIDAHLRDQQADERMRRVIFTAPAISLIDQTVDRFRSYGIPLGDIGVLQADHPLTNPMRPVQIASVQTLARREIPRATFCVIDEVHQQFESIEKWMDSEQWKRVPFLGLSATPWSKGLGKRWFKLIQTEDLPTLTEKKWFKKLRYYRPSTLDTSNVRITAGDYNEHDLSEASRQVHILSDAVQRWIELGQNRPTIAFCVDRLHARSLQERFEQAQIPCGYIDGTMDRAARDAVEAQLRNGHIKIVASVGCLTTGIDWPYVSCILWARKTRSKILWIQGIGRGLRPHPDSDDCILIDCVGNEELGHPYDVRHGYLDDGSKSHAKHAREEREKVKEAKQCPACKIMKPAGKRTCPECGHTPPVHTRVREGNARLVEVQAGEDRTPPPGETQELRQAWYDALAHLASVREYKRGWIAYCYRDRFGAWPGQHKIIETGWETRYKPPSAMVQVDRWVRARAIRHRKRREKDDARNDRSPTASLPTRYPSRSIYK